MHIWTLLGFCLFAVFPLRAEDGAPKSESESVQSVEEIVEQLKPSVVVIRSSDRRGAQGGLGSGFVVDADGLIATNFHVIGSRRRFTVEFADGRTFKPVEIVASDEKLDLALIRIEASGLKALKLGDADALKPGQTVAAVGNPLGFQFSAAQGVVAEPDREFDGRRMVQVAMPIEPGSSGSPLVNLAGEVVGVIAIKSGSALGFACRSNDLSKMIQSPRPVSFDAWLTVGALDEGEWESVMGGDWRQRAGRIIASGQGTGFGGRMLCLSKMTLPSEAFEVEVEVKLEDESGAAGLVFHSDGGNRHFGFYPTNGQLRLTRFEGPDVFSWNILTTFPSDHYRPGEWNRLRVRVEGTKIQCFVADQKVFETMDDGLPAGRVGICKFREPGVEFRRFRAGAELKSRVVPEELLAKVHALAQKVYDNDRPAPKTVGKLSSIDGDAEAALLAHARRFEKRAKRLRDLAALVRHRRTVQSLAKVFESDESDIDLIRCALLIARGDNPDLQVDAYLAKVDRMTERVSQSFVKGAGDFARIEGMMRVFFDKLGFHGNSFEYYDRSNSFINEVIDDREGLPITLSLMFMEIARRVNLNVVGIGIPRHFIVEIRPEGGDAQLVDVFAGKKISREEAAVLAMQPLSDADFVPTDKRGIIARILRNLFGLAEADGDAKSSLRYVDLILVVQPDSVHDRLQRSRLLYLEQRFEEAADDLDWLIEKEPEGIDMRALREFRDSLRSRTEL